METTSLQATIRPAESIPYVTADEAYHLLQVQLNRLIALVETLDPADWALPTACSLWTVRDILAHQAGGYASGTSYREMVRQYASLPRRGQLPEDAVNDLQLRERAGRLPAELIAELRAVGPVAIQKWAYQFGFVKPMVIPHPVSGTLSLRHLMWVIHSRDTWMHRLDICRATGREFEQTATEDGRIVELVMLDVEKKLRKSLDGKAVVFDLTGISGGAWKIGVGDPASTIQMDALDFNIFASGRYSLEEACRRLVISGDQDFAQKLLKKILILF